MAESCLIQVEELRRLCLDILKKRGISEEHARITADNLIEAEIRGVSSHGVNRLIWYSERIADGGINPHPDIRVEQEFGSTAVINGDNGLGAVVSDHALKHAVSLSESFGSAVVGVKCSNHYGACACWSEQAAKAGCICITLTNGGVAMAPWGGVSKVLATNPIGISAPMRGGDCMTLDIAITKIAGGKLDIAAKKGEKIPEGLVLTKEGLPTTDPAEGRKGLFLPIGDHKGYGLAVMFEILSAVLMGARFSNQIAFPPKPGEPMGVGHYFHVLKVSAFSDVEVFYDRMEELKSILTGSERIPGVERIYVPGEIENMKRSAALKDGVNIAPAVLEQLRAL